MKRYFTHVSIVFMLAIVVLGLLSGCSFTTPSSSISSNATTTSTLNQVTSRGVLRVGVILSFPPFGLRSASGQPQGYDVDIATAVAQALDVKLEITDTTSADRIPYLQTGKVDLVIGNFTRTLERAKAITFTDPYVVAGEVLLVKKNSNIKGISDLSGKTVAVTKGSTNADIITSANPKAKIQQYDTSAEALLAVKQGQADAMIEDSNYLTYQAKLDPTLTVTHDSLVPLEYNAFGLRQGDSTWLSWLNLFIFELNSSGQNKALYKKWFGQDPAYPLQPTY
jgi:polar amino acid transport system substrate-binding protein